MQIIALSIRLLPSDSWGKLSHAQCSFSRKSSDVFMYYMQFVGRLEYAWNKLVHTCPTTIKCVTKSLQTWWRAWIYNKSIERILAGSLSSKVFMLLHVYSLHMRSDTSNCVKNEKSEFERSSIPAILSHLSTLLQIAAWSGFECEIVGFRKLQKLQSPLFVVNLYISFNCYMSKFTGKQMKYDVSERFADTFSMNILSSSKAFLHYYSLTQFRWHDISLKMYLLLKMSSI